MDTLDRSGDWRAKQCGRHLQAVAGDASHPGEPHCRAPSGPGRTPRAGPGGPAGVTEAMQRLGGQGHAPGQPPITSATQGAVIPGGQGFDAESNQLSWLGKIRFSTFSRNNGSRAKFLLLFLFS